MSITHTLSASVLGFPGFGQATKKGEIKVTKDNFDSASSEPDAHGRPRQKKLKKIRDWPKSS